MDRSDYGSRAGVACAIVWYVKVKRTCLSLLEERATRTKVICSLQVALMCTVIFGKSREVKNDDQQLGSVMLLRNCLWMGRALLCIVP